MTDTVFPYSVLLENLVEGTWYEAAERYAGWARQQSWCSRGPVRPDGAWNRTWLENTSLAVFGSPCQADTVKKMEDCIAGNHLHILMRGNMVNGGRPDLVKTVFDNSGIASFVEHARERGDHISYFEFPSFYQLCEKNDDPTLLASGMKKPDGTPYTFSYCGITCQYGCFATPAWNANQQEKDRCFLEQCGADSLYHDVGVGAVHPKRCYDATHPHGTRVNQVQASMEQMRGFYEMTRARGGIYGQELIFEQMLPYLDFYQCRANGGMLTHMEHTRLLPLLEDCRAEKLPLFEYVYGDLGAIRIDG
jgi:hypothetical protein